MGYGLIFGACFYGSVVLGFAYIIWIFANKEAGSVKLIGQVISALIALMIIVGLFYAVSLSSKMGSMGAGCGPMMMDGHGMGQGMKMGPAASEKMSPEMMKMKMEMMKKSMGERHKRGMSK